MVVEIREKKGEGSAWSLCSGLPLRRAQARQPSTSPFLLFPSLPTLTGAPERASQALPSHFSSLLPTLTGAPERASHALSSHFSSLLPTLTGALERASHALSSHFFSLLPTLTGALERASHALPSTFFSLLPTLIFSSGVRPGPSFWRRAPLPRHSAGQAHRVRIPY